MPAPGLCLKNNGALPRLEVLAGLELDDEMDEIIWSGCSIHRHSQKPCWQYAPCMKGWLLRIFDLIERHDSHRLKVVDFLCSKSLARSICDQNTSLIEINSA